MTDAPCAKCGGILGPRSIGTLCAACYDLTELFNSAKWERAGPFLGEVAAGRISRDDIKAGKVWNCQSCGDWGLYTDQPTHICEPGR